MKRFLLLFIIHLLLLSGCKKKIFDYRNKYLGTWNFEVEITERNTLFTGYSYHQIVNYKGKIEYGNSNDELKITYLPQNTIFLKIDSNGNFIDLPPKTFAEFYDKKNLYFTTYSGGLGGGISYKVNGKKLKKD